MMGVEVGMTSFWAAAAWSLPVSRRGKLTGTHVGGLGASIKEGTFERMERKETMETSSNGSGGGGWRCWRCWL